MKDKLFLNTNVVIDLLGEREPYYNAAAQITTMADKSKIFTVVSALTYSTAYYLLSKFEDNDSVISSYVIRYLN